VLPVDPGALEGVGLDSAGEALVHDYVDDPNRTPGAVMERDLAIHLGENLADNTKPLNWLYYLLIAGIIGLGLEVLFWLLSM
jgi:hypothetical protein